jgi:hypothetical protein
LRHARELPRPTRTLLVAVASRQRERPTRSDTEPSRAPPVLESGLEIRLDLVFGEGHVIIIADPNPPRKVR